MSDNGTPPKPRKGFRRIGADRYRAIELRTWDLVRPVDSDSTRLFFYYYFGPHSTPYGIQKTPSGYALVDLEWTPEQLTKAQETLETADLVWRDGDLVVIVPFLMSNPPANEDVVKHWRKAVASLPSSPLFKKLYLRASAWVTEDGLSWLSSKLDTVSDTVSTPSPDRGGDRGGDRGVHGVDTQYAVSVCSNQEAGSREQDTEGMQGEEKGEPVTPTPALKERANGGDRSSHLRQGILNGFTDSILMKGGFSADEIRGMRLEMER